MDPDALDDFGNWLVGASWDEVFLAKGSNAKALAYERIVNGGVAAHFPMKTTRRKDTDPPWINEKVRRKIRRRKAVYREQGRSPLWKSLKKATDRLIKEGMRTYQDSQRIVLLAGDGHRCFFKNAKAYMSKDRLRPFSVSTLFPGKKDDKIASLLAVHFNKISREFTPLEPQDIPITYPP